jgi:hypothetical protein
MVVKIISVQIRFFFSKNKLITFEGFLQKCNNVYLIETKKNNRVDYVLFALTFLNEMSNSTEFDPRKTPDFFFFFFYKKL